jgi:putative oxidoreductase
MSDSMMKQRIVARGGMSVHGAARLIATVVRGASGVVFVSFGVGKFTDHAGELASFRHYGVPVPGLAVWAVGVVELAGGILLIAGLFTKAAAALLATNLAGVVATAGRVDGGLLNLGLAPTLLVGMIVLLVTGPGPLSVHSAVATRRRCGWWQYA